MFIRNKNKSNNIIMKFNVTNPYINYSIYKSIIKNYIIGLIITIIIFLFFVLPFIYLLCDIKDLKGKSGLPISGIEQYKIFFGNLCSNNILKCKKTLNGEIIGIDDNYKLIILFIYGYVFISLCYIILTIINYNIISSQLTYSDLNDTNIMDGNILTKGNRKKIISKIMGLIPILISLILPCLLLLYQKKIERSSFNSFIVLFVVILLPFILINGYISKGTILNNLYNIVDTKDNKWVDSIKKETRNIFNPLLLLIYVVYFITTIYIYIYNSTNKRRILIVLMMIIILILVIYIKNINIIIKCNDKSGCNIMKKDDLYNIDDELKKKGVNNIYQAVIKYNFPCFMK